MMFRNKFPAVLLLIFITLSINAVFGLTLEQTRSKTNWDDLLPFTSKEEEECSLVDSCTVDNVTSDTITVRWPCCAGKTFDLTSKPFKFSRYRDPHICSCWNDVQNDYGSDSYEMERNDYKEKEKTLRTSNCFATFSSYCPYGDYELYIKSGKESCSLRQTTLPAVPQWTVKRAIAEDKILLSWKNTYCTNFKQPIYRISWTDPDLVEIEDERAETTMTLTFLAPNTKYLIKLRACDKDRNKNDKKFCSENATVEVTTKPGTPSEPMNVIATAVNSTAIFLTWNPPENPRGFIDGYAVVCLKGRRVVQNVTISGREHRSYLITNLQSWTHYICAVQAFNIDPAKVKRISTRSIAETITKPEAPSEPLHLKVDEIISTELLLSWERPSKPCGPIDGYYVRVYNEREDRVEVLLSTIHQHRFINLSPGTDYDVSVYAFNYDVLGGIQDGNHIFNGTQSTISTRTKPAAPSSPRDVKVVKRTPEQLILKWKRPSTPGGPINGYVIKVLTDESEEVLEGQALYHRLTNLSPNTNYTIAIFAFNMDGNKRLDGEQVIVNSATKPDELNTAEVFDHFQTSFDSFKESSDNFKTSFDSFKEDTNLELSRIRTILNQTFQALITDRRQRDLAAAQCIYPPCP